MAQGFQRKLTLYGKPESYFVQLPEELQQKRDWLVQSLDGVGMKPIVPEGTYFLVADISQFSESPAVLPRGAGCGTTGHRDRNLHKPSSKQGWTACSPSKLRGCGFGTQLRHLAAAPASVLLCFSSRI